MASDAEKREQSLTNLLANDSDIRDRRSVERLDNESLNGRLTNLEAKMQNQWKIFGDKWEDKMVQLEGAITMAEFWIQKKYSGGAWEALGGAHGERGHYYDEQVRDIELTSPVKK